MTTRRPRKGRALLVASVGVAAAHFLDCKPEVVGNLVAGPITVDGAAPPTPGTFGPPAPDAGTTEPASTGAGNATTGDAAVTTVPRPPRVPVGNVLAPPIFGADGGRGRRPPAGSE
jgi:hypothetical protein